MKYIVAKTGEEAKIGEYICNSETEKTPFGFYIKEERILYTPESEKYLIDNGYIVPNNDSSVAEMALRVLNSLKSQLDSLNMSAEQFLKVVKAINNAAFNNIVLKKVAVECDKNYNDYISNANEIFVIEMENMKIVKLWKERITSYRNFAAFRTEKDAQLGLDVIKYIVNSLNV